MLSRASFIFPNFKYSLLLKPVLAPPILDRINPLLYSDNGSVQAIGAYFILQEVLARQSNKQFDVFSGKGSESYTIKIIKREARSSNF